MRSKRVAQTCDVIPGRSATLTKARHGLQIPPSLALRVGAAW